MPSIVYCDYKDCLYYDDYYECCDVDKLVIEHGACMGSVHHGRNVSVNDSLSVGTLLSHIPAMTHVEIQTEDDEVDGVCSYEGPAMDCPDELRALAVNIFSPHTYLDRYYLNILVR